MNTEQTEKNTDLFAKEVKEIRKIIERDPDYVSLDEEKLRELVRNVMEERARTSDDAALLRY